MLSPRSIRQLLTGKSPEITHNVRNLLTLYDAIQATYNRLFSSSLRRLTPTGRSTKNDYNGATPSTGGSAKERMRSWQDFLDALKTGVAMLPATAATQLGCFRRVGASHGLQPVDFPGR